MAYSFIIETIGSGYPAPVTPAVDTTGADLIVVGVASPSSGLGFTESPALGNTFTPLTELAGIQGGYFCLWYCQAPVTDTSHVIVGASIYQALAVLAVSGSAASPADQENQGSGAYGQGYYQNGSVTPGENDELIVTFTAENGFGATPLTIDSGFSTPTFLAGVAGQWPTTAMGYLIQTSAASVNPTWGDFIGWDANVVTATFKAQGVPAGAALGAFLQEPVIGSSLF